MIKFVMYSLFLMRPPVGATTRIMVELSLPRKTDHHKIVLNQNLICQLAAFGLSISLTFSLLQSPSIKQPPHSPFPPNQIHFHSLILKLSCLKDQTLWSPLAATFSVPPSSFPFSFSFPLPWRMPTFAATNLLYVPFNSFLVFFPVVCEVYNNIDG